MMSYNIAAQQTVYYVCSRHSRKINCSHFSHNHKADEYEYRNCHPKTLRFISSKANNTSYGNKKTYESNAANQWSYTRHALT